MTGGYHPSDRYSRDAARTTTSTRLTINYEDVVRNGFTHDVQLLASVAIARVAELERQNNELLRDRWERDRLSDNVVPLRPGGAA